MPTLSILLRKNSLFCKNQDGWNFTFLLISTFYFRGLVITGIHMKVYFCYLEINIQFLTIITSLIVRDSTIWFFIFSLLFSVFKAVIHVKFPVSSNYISYLATGEEIVYENIGNLKTEKKCFKNWINLLVSTRSSAVSAHLPVICTRLPVVYSLLPVVSTRLLVVYNRFYSFGKCF